MKTRQRTPFWYRRQQRHVQWYAIDVGIISMLQQNALIRTNNAIIVGKWATWHKYVNQGAVFHTG